MLPQYLMTVTSIHPDDSNGRFCGRYSIEPNVAWWPRHCLSIPSGHATVANPNRPGSNRSFEHRVSHHDARAWTL